jgi:predicted transposase YbfD/YdcC
VVETVDGDHGRVETRRYWTTGDIAWTSELGWEGLSSITMVESERANCSKVTTERRFFISSLPAVRNADIAKAIRAHWGVENNLHWVLDVAFREDESRTRAGNAPANLATIRQIALNLLKQQKSVKAGIHNKRLLAGWDEKYLLKVLGI